MSFKVNNQNNIAQNILAGAGEQLEKGRKAHPVGYINNSGEQKQGDGTWKYVGKNVKDKKDSKVEDAKKKLGVESKKREREAKERTESTWNSFSDDDKSMIIMYELYDEAEQQKVDQKIKDFINSHSIEALGSDWKDDKGFESVSKKSDGLVSQGYVLLENTKGADNFNGDDTDWIVLAKPHQTKDTT